MTISRGFEQAFRCLQVLSLVTTMLGLASCEVPSERGAGNVSYTMIPAPNYRTSRDAYSGCSGGVCKGRLNDGKLAQSTPMWSQPETLGWVSTEPVVITFDLLSRDSISGLSFSTAAGTSDVRWPEAIYLFTSDDNQNFYFSGDLIDMDFAENGALPAYGAYRKRTLTTTRMEAFGRYVALVVHGAPYVFTDEVRIERGLGGAPVPRTGRAIPKDRLRAYSPPVHVATTGNDVTGDGSRSKPFATLNRARAFVRPRLMEGNTATVLLRGGTYFLSSPVLFEDADSGKGVSVNYRAYPGESPILSGGKIITGFRENGGLWQADIPEVKSGSLYFEQLYVNDRRAQRSRAPKAGDYHLVRMPAIAAADRKIKFVANKSALAGFESLQSEERQYPKLVILHQWEASQHHISNLAPLGNLYEVTLDGPAHWSIPAAPGNVRFYLEGVPRDWTAEESKGQWLLNRSSGQLTYKPLNGETLAKAVIVAPVLETLLEMSGAHDVRFSGIRFYHTGYPLPLGGFSSAQASVGNRGRTIQVDNSPPSMIQLKNTRNISFQGCELAHTGVHGIHATQLGAGVSEGLSIRDSHLFDLGGGGIYLGHRTESALIENNIVRSGGHVFHGAVGIWIGQSHRNRVAHNDISDFRYSGISLGWGWSYAEEYQALDNRIEFNHIHHLLWGLMSDGGGIYTQGKSDGTVIQNNVVHHVYASNTYGMGGYGLYNDAGTSGLVMRNNLVHHVSDGGYNVTIGKEIKVENNIFALGEGRAISRFTKECNHTADFTRNIVLWNHPAMLNGSAETYLPGGTPYAGMGACTTADPALTGIIFGNNLYQVRSAANPRFGEYSFSTWQTKRNGTQDQGSRIGGVSFLNPDAGVFSFSSASQPALNEIGFTPFDPNQAGVERGSPLFSVAQGLGAGPADFSDRPTIPDIQETFEGLPDNAQPLSISGYSVKPAAAPGDYFIGVADNPQMTGGKCLKIVDSAGTSAAHYPFLWLSYPKKDAAIRLEFDLRISDENVSRFNLQHEWRDPTTGAYYSIGPAFKITGSGVVPGQSAPLELNAGGRKLSLPVNSWIHFKIEMGTGARYSRNWNLSISGVKDGVPFATTVTLPFDSTAAPFQKFEGLYFISYATDKTTYYLDNIQLTGTH